MIAHFAGAVLCGLFTLAGLVLGLRQRKAEWLFFALVMALTGTGIVLFVLLTTPVS